MRCWLATVALVAGCHYAVRATPSSRVYRGPAFAHTPHVVAALPVECRNCAPNQLDAIAMQTRMGLELRGYTVVDTELVNAEARMRLRTSTEQLSGTDNELRTEEVTTTPAWTQLSPRQQHELLIALGVDGVLHTSVTMTYTATSDFHQTILIALAVEQLDGTVAWRSDCGTSNTGDDTNTWMIERLGQCALDSEALW